MERLHHIITLQLLATAQIYGVINYTSDIQNVARIAATVETDILKNARNAENRDISAVWSLAA